MDTGATDHVCHNLQFFSSYKRIKPIHVKLPDGSFITANFFGTVFFNKNLFLTDVLYIPDFNFNLISITRLTNTIYCELLIDKHSCLIQEKQSSKMIGLAKCSNGLYILDDAAPMIKHASVACNFHSLNNNIWHQD
jgi:hypothetical protein